MKNYIQAGESLELLAPYDVTSGAGLLVGSIFGIATDAALSGNPVITVTEGVYDLAALSTDSATVGTKAYWDNTNKRITVTSSGNTYVGVFVKAKAGGAQGDTTAQVRLNGSFA